jgi:hypothetical protein
MAMLFEELDYRDTPLGELSLRRRYDPRLEAEVYEIKLGEDFLMTNHFTASSACIWPASGADFSRHKKRPA